MGMCSSAKPKPRSRRASLRRGSELRQPGRNAEIPLSVNSKLSHLETYYEEKQDDIHKKLRVVFERALQCRSHEEAELKLSFIPFPGEKINHLLEILPFYQHIEKLNLWKCRLGPEGAKRLIPHISVLRNLTVLGMEENNLGDEGTESVATSIASLEQLCDLHLHINSIGDKGILALAAALDNKYKLELLSVCENRFTAVGLRALLERFKLSNSRLRMLNLSSNSLGKEGAEVLLQLLPTLPSLERLYITNNGIPREEEDGLKKVLKKTGIDFLA